MVTKTRLSLSQPNSQTFSEGQSSSMIVFSSQTLFVTAISILYSAHRNTHSLSLSLNQELILSHSDVSYTSTNRLIPSLAFDSNSELGVRF
ncbi:unnamed protein product [Camellia sinensis]